MSLRDSIISATHMPGGANPALNEGDPQEEEHKFLKTQTHNRLTARTVTPAPYVENADDSGGAIGLGVAVGWNGSNRRNNTVRDNGRRRRNYDVIRYHRTIDPRSGILNSVDGLVYIQLGTPTLDKIWELRQVLITYIDPWTAGAVNSQAAVFVGGPQTGPKIADLVMMGIAIPASVMWTRDQQTVLGGQMLYVVINQPGANTGGYQASAEVCEYDLACYRAQAI